MYFIILTEKIKCCSPSTGYTFAYPTGRILTPHQIPNLCQYRIKHIGCKIQVTTTLGTIDNDLLCDDETHQTLRQIHDKIKHFVIIYRCMYACRECRPTAEKPAVTKMVEQSI